jgi:hypothetical protein
MLSLHSDVGLTTTGAGTAAKGNKGCLIDVVYAGKGCCKVDISIMLSRKNKLKPHTNFSLPGPRTP